MDSDRHKPTAGTEHYTPEEMMARLKRNHRQKRHSSSKDDGKLVTREDGTQVVKVRHRKRRSKQPQKAKKKHAKIKWAILSSIITLGILLTAGTVFIIAKYNGSSFKEETEANITKLSGANYAEVTQMRVTPISAKASKATLTWDQHSFIESAVFHHLDADILATSFLSNDWIGEEIVSSQAKVIMKTPISSAEISSDPLTSPYKFGSYRCEQLNLHFGNHKGAPTLAGMRVALWTLPNGQSQIIFNNGRMIMTGWPELEIYSGVATLNATNTEVEALLIAGEVHKGELTIKGLIQKNTNQPISLDVMAKNYPIQELLGKRLGRLIRGEVSSEIGTLQYHYDKPSNQAFSFVMPFESNEIQITEFPMLNDLKNLMGDTQYVRPIFNDCKGTLKRTSEGDVIIENIDFKSSGVMTLNGKIFVQADGKMTGELIVSIPRSLFNPSKIPAGFIGPKDGVYSAQVTVSGTIHNPYDNLGELLKSGDEGLHPKPKPKAIPPVTPSFLPDEKEFEDLLR